MSLGSLWTFLKPEVAKSGSQGSCKHGWGHLSRNFSESASHSSGPKNNFFLWDLDNERVLL